MALLSAVFTAASLAAQGAADKAREILPASNDIPAFTLADLGHALLCLVVAAVLGAILAFRPRRPGAPPHVSHVAQTQIMLAIVGCLVMLVVGASLARAFAIAGAAGLVRYRSKIDDPKDASVMLSSLAVGLASGVGLLYLAAAGTAFILAVISVLEWREPWPPKNFELKVSAPDPSRVKAGLEALLTRHHITFELRGSTEKDVTYLTQVPHGRRTDKVSEAIVALGGSDAVAVAWDEKKAAK
jgi:hypothetical protein